MTQWVTCVLYKDQITGLYHPHKRLGVGYVSMTSVLGKQRGEGSQDLLPSLAELVNSNFEGGGNLFK